MEIVGILVFLVAHVYCNCTNCGIADANCTAGIAVVGVVVEL